MSAPRLVLLDVVDRREEGDDPVREHAVARHHEAALAALHAGLLRNTRLTTLTLTGTPAIVLEDGNMIRGYVPADTLAKGLGLL